jgi:hypothetical protein
LVFFFDNADLARGAVGTRAGRTLGAGTRTDAGNGYVPTNLLPPPVSILAINTAPYRLV